MNNGVAPDAEGAQAPIEAQNRFFQSLVNRLESPGGIAKAIPCEVYRIGTDFDLWSPLFVDTIKAVHNLRSTDQARIDALCLTWLPTKLQAGETRSVYENLPPNVKLSWPALKTALSKAFRDEAEEIAFINNEAAWRKTPTMTLRDYKNGLTHRLDKYQPSLRDSLPAKLAMGKLAGPEVHQGRTESQQGKSESRRISLGDLRS